MALTKVASAGIVDDTIAESKLDIHAAPSGTDKYLKYTSNGMEWATVAAGGISDIVSDTSPQLGGDLDTNSFEISLDDSHKVKFGDGNDLEIYHDSTNSNIINNTGDLYIQTGAAKGIYIRPNNGENGIILHPDGAVDLYYDNVKKLNTHADGIEVLGKLYMADSKNIELGSSQDLKIYHDGSHSYITNAGTGRLYINAEQINLHNKAVNENMLRAVENGAVTLYYDGSSKFETTSSGVSVTGAITASQGGTITGNTQFNGAVDIGDDNGSNYYRVRLGASQDLQIYHDGTDSYLVNATNDLILQSTGDDVHIKAADDVFLKVQGSEAGIDIHGDAGVSVYYDGSKKFETKSYGCNLVGNLHMTSADSQILKFGEEDDLQIFHDGSNSYIRDSGTGNLILQATDFQVKGYNTGEVSIAAAENGAVELYYDNSKKFETSNGGAEIFGKLWCDGIDCEDNEKIALGASDDLEIYHDGNNSLIKNSTGSLNLYGDDVGVLNAAADEWKAKFISNGSVELYEDNAKKFETTADGVAVTGGQYTGELALKTNDGNQRGRIYSSSGSWTTFQSGHNETYMQYVYDAAVELYFNAVKQCETDANGLKFADGKGITLGTDGDMTIRHSVSDTTFNRPVSGAVNFYFEDNDATTNFPMRIGKTQGASTNERHGMFSFSLPGVNRGNAMSASSNTEAPIWAASSDYRIKENFRAYTGGWDAIKAIPVQLYDEKSPSYWTQGSDKKDMKGWKAHEVQAVIPEAVTGDKDAVVTQAMIDAGNQYQQSELGQIVPQQLGTTAMIPTIIGALQQAMAKIETLETKVTALEAG